MLMTRTRSRDFEVTLPPALRRLGATTRASVTGPEDAPLIVILGGISGNRALCGAKGWWPGLVGAGGAVDPARHRVLGLDFAADATGKSAPSTHEQAHVLVAALDAVGARKAHAIVGASYGGMVALALAEQFPERVERLVVISASAAPHPAATATRELQRRVVALGLATGKSEEALSIARGMAMLTYRTPAEFEARFKGGIPCDDPVGCSDPGAYLRARGDAYPAVMSPERFLSLSASLDRHQIDPANITAPALLIGASSDQLVPPAQMRALADALGGPAELHLLDCLYGHDMFLKEATVIGALAGPFVDAA